MGRQNAFAASVARRPSGGQVAFIQADRQGFMIPGNPFGGSSFFVNEASGSDGNDGTVTKPFASLDAALAAATANSGDSVYLMGTSHRTSTLNWNKNGVNLIGLLSPSNNSRARISASGTTFFTPLVNVTGQGCRIENIATFYGFVDALASVCWAEAGGRNFYDGVEFFGGGNATGAAQAGMRSITIAGNGENEFDNCTFGLNTIDRNAANATLEFLAGNQRNIFRDAVFQMRATNAGAVHIKALTGALDREQVFTNPVLLNSIDSGATPITACCSVAADAGGAVVMLNPLALGAGKISAAGPVYVTGPVPNGGTSGLAVAAS